MIEETLTEDLLKRLIDAATPQAYLNTGETINYLHELLGERNLKRADVVRASGLNSTVVYDVFKGKSCPGRNNAIMLAFGLGCTLRQAQRLLRLAGTSELWPKVRRDAIIAWCIDRGLSRTACDDELWRLGEKTLLGTGCLR